METKELIAKIEALKTFAADLQEKHETRLCLLRPKWLDSLPVQQFVDLCDAYEHDAVPANKYPSTWIKFGDTQLAMSCEAVDLPIPQRVDHLETLRAMTPQSAAA